MAVCSQGSCGSLWMYRVSSREMTEERDGVILDNIHLQPLLTPEERERGETPVISAHSTKAPLS